MCNRNWLFTFQLNINHISPGLSFVRPYLHRLCLEFLVHRENVTLNWRRHRYQWRAANFEILIYYALIAIVPDLLWHGTSVYNGHHLRASLTLTPITKLLTLMYLRLRPVATRDRTPISRMPCYCSQTNKHNDSCTIYKRVC